MRGRAARDRNEVVRSVLQPARHCEGLFLPCQGPAGVFVIKNIPTALISLQIGPILSLSSAETETGTSAEGRINPAPDGCTGDWSQSIC